MGPLHELFESWISGEEDWRKSQTFIRITDSDGNINSDLRDWLTRAELQQKVGEEAAKEMIDHMERHNPEKCRYHPDAPGVQETPDFLYSKCHTFDFNMFNAIHPNCIVVSCYISYVLYPA